MSICNRRNLVLSAAGLLIPGISWPLEGEPSSEAALISAVKQALSTFLLAFDNLNWPAFRACFASDVTMFHPAPPNIKRIDSAEAFEKAWLGVFARIKKQSGRDTPPYMDLQPQDLRIQILSPEIALATFHLIDGDTINRRSIVFKQYPPDWKIVHLHASNIKVAAV